MDIEGEIVRGDQLLRSGGGRAAFDVYLACLSVATHRHRAGIVARLGFSGHPNALQLLDIQQSIERLNQPPVFVADGLAVWKKTSSFVWDQHFLSAENRHAKLLPIPNWHWNLNTVIWAIKQARYIDGDFVELGVFKGHTTAFACEYVDFGSWKKTWWLYDTFAGIPSDQLDDGWAEKNSVAYSATFSFEEVKDRFLSYNNVKIIMGKVPDILSTECPEHISFLHMDLNNTKAEISALEFLFDRIAPGGIIIFDDYGWLAASAQHVAERDWMKARGLSILELPTGQGLFVKGT